MGDAPANPHNRLFEPNRPTISETGKLCFGQDRLRHPQVLLSFHLSCTRAKSGALLYDPERQGDRFDMDQILCGFLYPRMALTSGTRGREV